jgi:thioredoxin-related protein
MIASALFVLALGESLQTANLSAEWHTDLPEAQAVAKAANLPILINFTGSDWCHWCQVLKKEVFDKKEFKIWAKTHLVLLELDFPQKKKQSTFVRQQNEDIAKKFKVDGYPTLYFIRHDGKILGRTGYLKGGPAVWTKDAEKQLEAAAQRELEQS